MAVQIRNRMPVRRPLGQQEPPGDIDGLVELRLHGVGGTSPGDLLGDVAPELVAGDRIAGFYRTADQPTPADSDGPRVRHIEAYSWGGLTSRSASRVLWVLMLPFALANAVGWMCTKAVFDRAWLFFPHRFAVRFAGLVMTINVVVLLLMAGTDLIGVKCVASEDCQKAFPPANLLSHYWFAGHAGRAMAVGALLPVAVIALFFLLSRVSTHRYERVPPPEKRALSPDLPKVPTAARTSFEDTSARPGIGLADGRFWTGYGAARRMAALHLAAALAVVAGVLAWTTHHTFDANHADLGNTYVFWAAVALLALAVLTLISDRVMHWLTWWLVAFSGAALVGAILDAWSIGATTTTPTTVVSDMRWVLNGVYILMVLAILLALVGTVSAWKPGSFLIFGPVSMLVVAFTLVNAVGALIIMLLGRWIGFPPPASSDPQLHDKYFYMFVQNASVWCVTAALAATLVFVLVSAVTWWLYGCLTYRKVMTYEPYEGGFDPRDPRLDPDWTTRPNEESYSKWDRRWLRRIARARLFARLPRRFDLLVTAIAVSVTATLTVVVLRYHGNKPIEPASLLITGASAAAAAAPVALIAFMRWGWRSGTARRHIGIAWDVITFWPRAYHPFAPPCYAERAVPDLQWRLWHLQQKKAKVVIAAHSQGSVITAAALAQRDHRIPGSDIGLLTFGCPLSTLYKWAFPAYFNDDLFKHLTRTPTDEADSTVSAWINRYCKTDYIGNTDIEGACNQFVPDPQSPDYTVGQPRQPIGAHTGYWTHPLVWADIEALHRPAEPIGPCRLGEACHLLDGGTPTGSSRCLRNSAERRAPAPDQEPSPLPG